jgi:hypothetical protein
MKRKKKKTMRKKKTTRIKKTKRMRIRLWRKKR